ncbi:hypothetical protein TCAL_15125 [Tigriopus californicus]|uniref:Uncharacterized protein n=1 Tax=Tigriopus californicus TaxID=6832 RepID=A0A553NTS4_TIGCA|nr:hypothetical protein TCAL_15125 [Tigriopus californicus]
MPKLKRDHHSRNTLVPRKMSISAGTLLSSSFINSNQNQGQDHGPDYMMPMILGLIFMTALLLFSYLVARKCLGIGPKNQLQSDYRGTDVYFVESAPPSKISIH